MIEAVCPTPKSVRPDRMATIAGNTSQLHALRTEVLGLIAHPEGSSPERLTNVLAETIAWMGQTGSRWRPERLIGNGTRRRVAKLAQEFIEEHHCEVVQAEDLCRATGVGLRTVQRCFMNYFGLTYSSYLKTVRLDAARRDLLAADASHESVTTIAQRHGIRHRGRFSVDFRERFGVSPAETLNTRAVVKLKLDTSPRV